MAGKQTRAQYNEVRSVNPKTLDSVSRAARVIYLNKLGYNGLWRENASGQFNVPFGSHDSFAPDVASLCAAEEALNAVDTTIACGDFMDTLVEADAEVGDFVYFDCPYDPLTETSDFGGYCAGGFADQTRVADAFRSLAGRGVCALSSNHATPRVRALYRGLRMREVQVRRSIAASGSKRGSVPELLVASWDAWGAA